MKRSFFFSNSLEFLVKKKIPPVIPCKTAPATHCTEHGVTMQDLRATHLVEGAAGRVAACVRACLLKGATDRPESRALPAGRLLTALTALPGVACCQQLPLPIKQQPECQRDSERGGGGVVRVMPQQQVSLNLDEMMQIRKLGAISSNLKMTRSCKEQKLNGNNHMTYS